MSSKIVLASGSPQRRSLLDALGVEFEVIVPDVEEVVTGDPEEIVMRNARAKAQAVWALTGKGTTVIAGDTEVLIEGSALGQAADAREARSVLSLLSGRGHEVMSGLVVMGPELDQQGEGRIREGTERSTVRFRDVSSALTEAYIASGEWAGRAGAYAVQGLGSALVEEISGDLSNVIGLPIGLLLELAPELGTQPT